MDTFTKLCPRSVQFGWLLGCATKRGLGQEPTNEDVAVAFVMAQKFAPDALMDHDKAVRLSHSIVLYFQARSSFVIPNEKLEFVEMYAWHSPDVFLEYIRQQNFPPRPSSMTASSCPDISK